MVIALNDALKLSVVLQLVGLSREEKMDGEKCSTYCKKMAFGAFYSTFYYNQ